MIKKATIEAARTVSVRSFISVSLWQTGCPPPRPFGVKIWRQAITQPVISYAFRPAPPSRAALFDAVLREVIAQGPLADAHRLRGVLLHAVGALERAPHRLALGPIEVLPEGHRRQPRRRGRRHSEQPHHFGSDHRARGEHDGPLHGVLELAHVARPVGGLQRFEHARLDAVYAL